MPQYPHENSLYKQQKYWDDRYSHENTYEWCKPYPSFRHLLTRYVEKGSKILILGCGNSQLSEDLYEDGYEHITNVDFSSVVLQNMSSRSKGARMEWLTMDIKKLMFLPKSFDVVLEKATLDSLLVEEKDPWRLSNEGRRNVTDILLQISELLVDGGLFLSLTFAQPHFRKKLLCQKRLNWSVEHFTYGDGFQFFFYVMVKGQPMLQQEEPQNLQQEYIGNPETRAIFHSDVNDENFLKMLNDL